MMSTFEQRKEEIEKMSREETLELLRELGSENEALFKRSQEMNEQLLMIAEQTKLCNEEKEKLYRRNKDLKDRLAALKKELASRV